MTCSLTISSLKFRYTPSGPWVIDIPKLELHAGEQVLLAGGSGKGKSTLLQLIAGLLDPVEGSVHVNGQDLHRLSGGKRDLFRGKTIGMIFQTFNLLHGFSAVENIMVAMMFSDIPPKEHRSRAIDLLKQLGIDEPERDATTFSIGQQQRVAVARALACDPVLVLADEPTASLDPENALTAVELIQSCCRERNAALLCVSHDPSLKSRFSRCESLETLNRASPAELRAP